MPRITDDLPEPVFRKLRIRKDQEGFGDKSWLEYFRYLTKDIALDRTLSEALGDTTRDNLAKLWMQNAAQNMPSIISGHKIWELPKLTTPALVVGAGPSVFAKNHLKLLADWCDQDPENRSRLVIFSTDRMLIPLVRADIIPEYVVSVDGNREKIVQWYQDALLENVAKQQMIKGQSIKAMVTITVAPNVVERCMKIGIEPYFFVAMLDQFTLTNNITRLLYFMTGADGRDGATAINCGGNAGSSAWVLANYLNAKQIAMIGMDYGYLKGTPIEETAYYQILRQNAKDPNQIFGVYFDNHNPDFNIDCYSDIMFGHYRDGFLNMLELAALTPNPPQTINCTEGGILHGGKIGAMYFKDWLDQLGRKLEAPIVQ